MTTSTPTVLVAAAPTLHREGLVALFREQWPHVQLSLTADATQVADLIAHHPYTLAVLDGVLPGQLLPELLSQLHRIRPTQRLLLLMDQDRSEQPVGPLPWPGTRLQLPRHVPPLALSAALAPWLDDQEEAALAYPAAACAVCGAFSPRELEVLRLVVADQCNHEIADRLCLSVRTVESHRRTLLHKAGTRTLVGLAARAVREGWVA